MLAPHFAVWSDDLDENGCITAWCFIRLPAQCQPQPIARRELCAIHTIGSQGHGVRYACADRLPIVNVQIGRLWAYYDRPQ